MLIPEPSECAHFWEVTTTGLHPLKKAKTPGGYQVTLPKLDQTAVILASPDPLQRDPIEERTMAIAPVERPHLDRAGQSQAAARREGRRGTDGPGTRSARRPQMLLLRAEQSVAHAETAFQQRDYNRAREESADAMQLLRTLQYAHWNEAVLSQGVTTPLLSPYTVSFQTLPDHWRLVERIGRSADRPQDNLLPSGDFEDPSSVRNEWIHSQHAIEGVRANAALISSRPSRENTACNSLPCPSRVSTPRWSSPGPRSPSPVRRSPCVPARSCTSAAGSISSLP